MTIDTLSHPIRTSLQVGLVVALLFSLPFVTRLAAETDLPGLAVGEKAPAFELQNASSQTVKLTDLTAHAPVALVFYRSAEWCPFCQRQLVDLQNSLDRLNETGITVVGISYDSTRVLDQFTRTAGIEFPLLADVGSETIEAYGILNQEAGGRAAGIPHPVIFIVNAEGHIAAKLGEADYRNRPSVDAIIAAVQSIRFEPGR